MTENRKDTSLLQNLSIFRTPRVRKCLLYRPRIIKRSSFNEKDNLTIEITMGVAYLQIDNLKQYQLFHGKAPLPGGNIK